MTLLEQIVAKHKEDREVIKAMKQRHAEELRVIEEFQAKRETALLARGDMTVFGYLTDIFINGRDGKASVEKQKSSIALEQDKIEHWLLKMLSQVGEGIKTEFGTVYKTRKEGVSCSDFEMFVDVNMLHDAAKKVVEYFDDLGVADDSKIQDVLALIHSNMHLEYLNKAVNKTAILETMGDPAKDGSRPNTPPAGINYTAIQCVGVRKAK